MPISLSILPTKLSMTMGTLYNPLSVLPYYGRDAFCLRSTSTVLYVYPLGSTLKNKDTTSYASSYDHGKRNKDRKKKL